MPISYAQNFEDIMLFRALRHIDKGFYIDIGAWDPNHDSVTKLFYNLGWHGINIEPSRTYFNKLNKYRDRDINLNVAIGSESGELNFFEVPGSGLSSLNSEASDRATRLGFNTRQYRVPVERLDSIVEKYCKNENVSFLKIDVEGSEKIIIDSVNWSVFRPTIIVVEAIHPDTRKPTWHDWEETLVSAQYIPAWFDGLNKFYIRHEERDLIQYFATPPSLFLDEFFLPPESRFVLPRFAGIRHLINLHLPKWLNR